MNRKQSIDGTGLSNTWISWSSFTHVQKQCFFSFIFINYYLGIEGVKEKQTFFLNCVTHRNGRFWSGKPCTWSTRNRMRLCQVNWACWLSSFSFFKVGIEFEVVARLSRRGVIAVPHSSAKRRVVLWLPGLNQKLNLWIQGWNQLIDCFG